MGNNVTFAYYQVAEADQFTFYRIPKQLFTDPFFSELSTEAKVLYGLMLDRMSLSNKNQWIDDQNRVYIIFPVEEIMEMIGCCRQKAIKIIAELDVKNGIGLIESKRLGLGKPNVIFVKNFTVKELSELEELDEKDSENPCNSQKYENHTSGSMNHILQEVQETDFKKYENHTSASMENILQEVRKTDSNNTDINNTDISKTLSHPLSISLVPSSNLKPETDGQMDQTRGIREILIDNIHYSWFEQTATHWDLEIINEMIAILEDCFMSSQPSFRIGRQSYPREYVLDRFLALREQHIQYVLDSLKKVYSSVKNIKSYILTALFNAPVTIDTHTLLT